MSKDDELALSSAENWTIPEVVESAASLYATVPAGVRRWRQLTQFGEKTDLNLDLPPRLVRVYGEARCGETVVLDRQERRLSYLLGDPGIKGERRTRIESGLAEIRERQARIARLIASENARQTASGSARQGIAKRVEESPPMRAMPELSDSEKVAKLQLQLEDLALTLLTETSEEAHKGAVERYLQLHREKQRLQAMTELQDNAEKARLRRQEVPSAGASTHSESTPLNGSASPEGSSEASQGEASPGNAGAPTPESTPAPAEGFPDTSPVTDEPLRGHHTGGSSTGVSSAVPVEVRKGAE